MKKFASFIPVIGIFLVFYLLIKVKKIEEIWPNGFYYYGSAAFQAVTIGAIVTILAVLFG